ncbi:MAG: transposase [Anaerohalosphaera sp.]|nr:transposase [Anaerohalosphaera sp.]
MSDMVAYMLTWTTYGTWLQGDERGWVKGGSVLDGNEKLYRKNSENMKKDIVWFGNEERQVVRKAIIDEAERNGLTVLAITVQNGHVHVVIKYDDRAICRIAGLLKNSGRVALGIKGRVWTTGYDVQYCFDEAAVRSRIRYVDKHEDGCGCFNGGCVMGWTL